MDIKTLAWLSFIPSFFFYGIYFLLARKLVIKIIGNKSFKDYSSPQGFLKDARRGRSILTDTLFSNKLMKSYPAEVRLIRIFGYPGLVFFAITFVLIVLTILNR